MTTHKTYVLDTGPLSHFAKAQWLGALKLVLADHHVVIPDVVEHEIHQGAGSHPHLVGILPADWIKIVALNDPEHVSSFTQFAKALVGPDGRNLGECGVLALAQNLDSAVAVIDDRAARKAADEAGLQVRGTVGLLCDAIHAKILTVPMVSAVADDLLATDYRMPFKAGDFAKWAAENGLI